MHGAECSVKHGPQRTGVKVTAASPVPYTTASRGSGASSAAPGQPRRPIASRQTKRCVSASLEFETTTSSMSQLPVSGPIISATKGPRFGPANDTSSIAPL